MKRFCFLLLLLLAACNEEDKKPSPYPPWVDVPSGWEFYNGSFSEPHYVVKRVSSLPGSVRIKYRIDGSGVKALDGGSPAVVTMILWRVGDNLSCAGEYQQYRYFGQPRMSLETGEHEYDIPLDPARWTDCYGKPGTDFPDRFKGTVDNIWKVGFGFGGYFAGHGAVSTGAIFHLLEFNP